MISPSSHSAHSTHSSDASTSSPDVINEHEAGISVYCRHFPTSFCKASGARIEDESGQTYIDFFSGAGALNYGHNPPQLVNALMDYLSNNGILHSLDMYTEAKHQFLGALYDIILTPRQLDQYKVAFCGPTGTNAVELALKYAREATGRHNVIAFTHAFHGMTLGALSLSANTTARQAAGVQLQGVTRMPFDGFFGDAIDTSELLETMLDDPGSGIDPPAAIVIETVQLEGGMRAASTQWLQRIEQIARKNNALLIVDDIQAGCGRTGDFFSFEKSRIKPDIVTLSKSLGGCGLPIALVLLAPEFDVLASGSHSGTFRGNDLAFVSARAALEFWQQPAFLKTVSTNLQRLQQAVTALQTKYNALGVELKGRGAALGLHWRAPHLAKTIAREAFNTGLIIETSGPRSEVLKFMPPLNIPEADLSEGFQKLEFAIATVLKQQQMGVA